jgi:hypothetical protein
VRPLGLALRCGMRGRRACYRGGDVAAGAGGVEGEQDDARRREVKRETSVGGKLTF